MKVIPEFQKRVMCIKFDI